MIRRGFWVLVGATGGIVGYRRVSSLGRQLSETLSPTARDGRDGRGGRGGQDGRGGRDAGATQPGGAGTPNGDRAGDASALNRKALSRQARRGLVRGTIRFTRDARRFGRDVREGMDLYMVRRAAQESPTLDAGAKSRRPPARLVAPAPGAYTDNDERVKDDR